MPGRGKASDTDLDLIFRNARTQRSWHPEAVAEDLLRRVYDLIKMAPTSANCMPARFIFVISPEGKEKLRPALSAGNLAQTMAAPVTAIVGYDLQFYEKLPALYRDADIFVLPSREEGIPAALLEAMATGLPIVCTRVAGAGAGEAVLHGDTGLLTPPDDSDALADALTQIMADPTLWERLGRAGRARIESYYSWTRAAEKWLVAIERAITATKTSA